MSLTEGYLVKVKGSPSGGKQEMEDVTDATNPTFVAVTVTSIADGTISISGGTITGATLDTPTIGDFTNATHDHQDDPGGGSLDAAAIGSGTIANARLDAELSAIAGLTSAANKVPYYTGSGTAALADFTSFGRSILDDADAATALGTLGLSTNLADLTDSEAAQLENIDITTISAVQWGYLGAMDQSLASGQSPTWAAITTTGGVTTLEGSTNDGTTDVLVCQNSDDTELMSLTTKGKLVISSRDNQGWEAALRFYSPGMVTGNRLLMHIGKEDAANASAWLDYYYDSVTAGNTYLGIGHNGLTEAVKVYQTGDVWMVAALEIDGDLNHDGSNVGFYGTAPTSQATHIADAETSHATADFAGVNSALDALGGKINSILTALENLGLVASS